MSQVTRENWSRKNLRNPHSLADKRSRVHSMFSAIAGSYDLLNHLLSMNMDKRWRKKAVELAKIRSTDKVLDICCGTGDLAFTFAKAAPAPAEVWAIDFVENMLEIARNKQKKMANRQSDRHNYPEIKWLCQDAESLSFPDNRFDRVSCAFGIRNLQDLSAGLHQAYRVLKPDGLFIILEFAIPKNPLLSWFYQCYFRLVLPLIAAIISNDRKGAYRYLPSSVRTFDAEKLLSVKLKEVGFAAVQIEQLCCGAVLAFVAQK